MKYIKNWPKRKTFPSNIAARFFVSLDFLAMQKIAILQALLMRIKLCTFLKQHNWRTIRL
jgi:hypothetical protein